MGKLFDGNKGNKLPRYGKENIIDNLIMIPIIEIVPESASILKHGSPRVNMSFSHDLLS
jgi:hypothetical protein